MTKKIDQRDIPEGPDFHPAVVAQAFGVHRRTVFRWVGYGYLKLHKALIRRKEVISFLVAWKNSCSFKEARNALGVKHNATIHSWENKGFLQLLNLFSEVRVSRVSIDALLAMTDYSRSRKKPLLNSSNVRPLNEFPDPKHTVSSVAILIDTLATEFNKGPKSPPQCGYRKRHLRLYNPEGLKMRRAVGSLRLTSPASAATFLGYKNPEAVLDLCDSGEIRGITILRKRLLYAESVKAHKAKHGAVQDRLLEIYTPTKPREVRAMRGMELVTYRSAADFLGIAIQAVIDLVRKRSMYTISIGSNTLLNAQSVRNYKLRSEGRKAETHNKITVRVYGERPNW